MIKKEWLDYVKENQKYYRKINNHHYFRVRMASKFWIEKIKEVVESCPSKEITLRKGTPEQQAEILGIIRKTYEITDWKNKILKELK